MFRRKRKVSDFGAEIEAHIDLETERLREQGLSYEDARCRGTSGFRQRDASSGALLRIRPLARVGSLLARHSLRLRMLRKSPGFTAIAVLTIALGIGATTAIFSVVDATLLHPLPYPQPEQLVSVEDDLPGVGAQDVGMSVPEWQDLQRSGIFEYVSLTAFGSVNLTGSSQPTRIRLLAVAPNYFAVLGVKPQLGRSFDPEDQTPGFTLEVAHQRRTVEASLRGRSGDSGQKCAARQRLVSAWSASCRPVITTRGEQRSKGTSNFGLQRVLPPHLPRPAAQHADLTGAIARIKPGLTIAAAQSRLDALVAALQKQFPDDYPLQSAWTVRLVPLKENVVGNVRQSLILLLGAVGLVLLIGCVNVANLLLARASARGREMAIRQALGAARTRLIRQLLTESVLLSLLGGIAGLAILFWTKEFLLQIVPDSLPRLNEVSINWSVLLFALVASLVAGAIFGLAPAVAGRPAGFDSYAQAGRARLDRLRGTGANAPRAGSNGICSVAGADDCCGPAAAQFWDLLNVRLGFNPQSVMAVRTWLPDAKRPQDRHLWNRRSGGAVLARNTSPWQDAARGGRSSRR